MYGADEAQPHPETNWPTCCVCRRELRADEYNRVACRPCQDRVDRNLAAIPGPDGLYARLSDALAPGAGASDSPRVATSRVHAPPPVRTETLNLMTERGPILGKLETWVRDWETYGRADLWEAGTLQRRVDHAVRTLRFNLAWAAAEHLAFDAFADETRKIVQDCQRQITGEKPERRVPVLCADLTCGRVLHVTVSTTGLRCGCGMEYDRSTALSLIPARRARAAA